MTTVEVAMSHPMIQQAARAFVDFHKECPTFHEELERYSQAMWTYPVDRVAFKRLGRIYAGRVPRCSEK